MTSQIYLELENLNVLDTSSPTLNGKSVVPLLLSNTSDERTPDGHGT